MITALVPIDPVCAGGDPKVWQPASPNVRTDAVNALLADPERAGHLGQAAREHAAEWFGMDRFVAETARLYEELAAAAGITVPG